MVIKKEKKSKRWWAWSAVLASIAMLFIDQTVLPVALPTIQREFHSSDIQLQWMINAYLLSVAAFTLAGGKLGDIWGKRNMFIFGISIFAISSGLCGISANSAQLITYRILQGIGGAIMMPVGGALITQIFPVSQRGLIIGTTVSLGSLFLSFGPLIGGFFTQYLNWRFVFWINIPIAIAGIIITLIYIEKSTRKDERFDFLGFIAFCLGIVFLSVALVQAQSWGWGSMRIIALFILAIVFITMLYLADKKSSRDTFFDFSLLHNRSILFSISSAFLIQMMLMITVFWPIYFQFIWKASPTYAGFITMLSTLPVIIAAPLAGKLVDHMGAKKPILLGFLIIIFAFIWFIFLVQKENLYFILPALFAIGCGVPFILTTASTTNLNNAPCTKKATAAGLFSTMRMCGGSFGVAIFGSILLNVQFFRFAKKLHSYASTKSLNASLFEGLLSSKKQALAAYSQLPYNSKKIVYDALHSSYEHAFILIHIIGAILLIIIFIIMLCFFKKKNRKA